MHDHPIPEMPAAIDDDRITTYGLVVEATRRLSRLFDRSLREAHDLTSVDFEALLRIGRSPGAQISMSDLADQMVVTSGGVTRMVDRLTGAGWVERVPCPSDRRVQWAHLTPDGAAKLGEALGSHLDDLDQHFVSRLSDAELASVERVMDRLRSG